MKVFIIFLSAFSSLNAILGGIYDAYSGKPATRKQIQLYNERNNSQYCAIDIKPCHPDEWRRVDGSCNNLKYPSRGAFRTPTIRLLTPEFSVDYEPRNAKSGTPLPIERNILCELLQEGRAHELDITLLVSHYEVFSVVDVFSIHDVLNYVENTTNCCTPEGKSNYACTPSKIPVHDQVHRYSGVRCQNLTRPQSFQYFGCRDFGTTFSRVYSKLTRKSSKKGCKIFPPGNHSEAYNKEKCHLNQYPKETLCFSFNPNGSLGSVLFLIIFYRQHNYIAEMLHKLNERLFYTARDINIAIHNQIYLYELLPVLLGKNNMIKDGIISRSSSYYRDMYNETILPQVSEEFIYMQRWLHTIQETKLKSFDKDGVFLKTFPLVNHTSRTGFVSNGENMAEALRGSFRQVSAKFDFTIDFDMAERVLGGQNFASDVATNDLRKGRYFGFPPYIKYREFCTKKHHKYFDDLKDVISEERLHRLRDIYDDVEDTEVMSGLYAENLIPGGRVPYTLYCIMIEQLKRTITSDRHWYERPNRPHAFTEEQREAIGGVTVAGVLCTQENSIHKIQPRAFYSIHRKKNPLKDCSSSKIGKLNLSSWKDTECKN